MAVSGGAVIPLLIGSLTDNVGVTAGMLVLAACAMYQLLVALYNLKRKRVE